MLTIEQLKEMPPGTVFAQGEIENSPNGVYMTDTNVGRKMIWVAKRGYIHDWAIYIHWANMGIEYIISNGDKVRDITNVKKLVPCDEEAIKMYRH